jgi:CheY-like chemotaxis protein/anti-sigma regulatory factor (Ser/Thr protein kinase)
VESTARPLVSKNANSFTVERGPNLGVMRADVTKLRQAIYNLLSNAAKFTHNGQITLIVRRSGDWMEIAVADTGIGISQEQQKALFSNFTQASAKIAAVYGGTGLGLSLSQNLCRLMGGRIEIESELGNGSRFTIRLPAQVEHPEAEPVAMPLTLPQRARQTVEYSEEDGEAQTSGHEAGRSGASRPAVSPDPRPRLLVVDDDRNFLELAERLFAREGFTPICTDAPQSALQIARTTKPTAIFLDILMPGFDGWDILAALKADPITADIPVFMISILSERSKALAAGADGIVMKPFDGSKVKAALAGLKATRGQPRAKAANG